MGITVLFSDRVSHNSMSVFAQVQLVKYHDLFKLNNNIDYNIFVKKTPTKAT